ncbi:MAG: antibiotic biosynthesis monooxygenase [Pyrinomonadaceae bacterium]|nr:antibiotic biosynthesis monooxygenase [Pyrinomonadaceae bacterium]
MSKIEANKGIITQINVFKVKPENMQALIDLLIEAAEAVKDTPGWISANFHRSLDGTRLVNYAQCESYESWEAVMKKLVEGNFLKRNKELAEANPGLYEVIYTVEKDN